MRNLLRQTLAVLVLSVALMARHGNSNNSGNSSGNNNPAPVNPATTGGQTTVTGILGYAGGQYSIGRVRESRQDSNTPNDRRVTKNDDKWAGRDPSHHPNYGPLDQYDRATGMSVTMNWADREATKQETNTTDRPDVPPGYVSGDHHKGHLLGAQFGGSNTDARNLVPLYPEVNTPNMRTIEGQVRRHMKANQNEDFTYTVTPNYTGSNTIPDSVTMKLTDSSGNPVQLKDANGNMLDEITLPNTP